VIEAVIFDLDGLILDSETPEFLAWQAIYAKYGLDLPRASWVQNIGRNDGPFDALGPFRGPNSPERPEAVVAAWRERRDALMNQYFHPLPGVVPLLAALRARGVRTGVASSSNMAWIRRVLTGLHLEAEFDAAAGGDEVARAKPAPDVYLLAAGRLGVAPRACAALEDSPNGIRAAKAAGMLCVAVPSPMTREMDFSSADVVVRSLLDVTLEMIAVADGPAEA